MGGDDGSYVQREDHSPLLVRIGMESLVAISSALSVAPAISIVDKAIVSNASGLEPLIPSLINGIKTLFFKPIYFFKQPSFLFIWGVYSGTYIVGNSIEALCERSKQSPFYPKFIGGSIANVTLSVLKDKAFASMFGTGPPKIMGLPSYMLFATRDSMTILASFSLPAIISLRMQRDLEMEKSKADTTAQLLLPISMQILSTPLHLLGLDVYNRPTIENNSISRIKFIQQEYLKTTLARMARIFPAYGVGGVINKSMRNKGFDYIQTFYTNK
eukprot:gene8602-11626_t